jgi:hypothetical protein
VRIVFLSTYPIKFCIRIRENLTLIQRGRELKALWLFYNLPLNQVRQTGPPAQCFFKAIKTAGFNIEDAHLTDQKRLEKLFAIVCIAFVWVYLVGDCQNQVKKIPILSHNRRAFSIFRYGLDAINKALLFDKPLITVYPQLLTRT